MIPLVGKEILLGPTCVTHSTLLAAPNCSAVCTGPAVWVAQLPIWPVPIRTRVFPAMLLLAVAGDHSTQSVRFTDASCIGMRFARASISASECSATGTAVCPLGHHRCLADITPADVAAAVNRLVA